jgi:2-polyprenyl-3-methyl-5-hydroxy-6-metoxy-1,4-benzoquinol methylase
MSSTKLGYATWHTDTEREPAMEAAHRPLWRHFIETIPETDLSTRDELDFGCNRGGFLRLLHALKPFRSVLGVDIARNSIAAASILVGDTPITYEVTSDLTARAQCFDIAFSYEVV